MKTCKTCRGIGWLNGPGDFANAWAGCGHCQTTGVRLDTVALPPQPRPRPNNGYDAKPKDGGLKE